MTMELRPPHSVPLCAVCTANSVTAACQRPDATVCVSGLETLFACNILKTSYEIQPGS